MPASTDAPASSSLLQRVRRLLAKETFAGSLILGAALLGILLANSPAADAYFGLRDLRFGPEALHLRLSVGSWAADGLLAVFFFIVGMELKHELVAGTLRNRRLAALPVVAAMGGVVVPASIYALVNLRQGAEALSGWAIPTATDIAFALAVFAIVGRSLPPMLRIFLLALAVVDDLIAIAIIAVFYTDTLSFPALALAAASLALFAWLLRRRRRPGWALVLLAVLTWGLVHASGIHATVAGVALGLVVPTLALPRREAERSGVASAGAAAEDGAAEDERPLTERFGHLLAPLSTGIAVPVFAFFSAGVRVEGVEALRSAFGDPVTLGVMLGLVIGKPVGIVGASFLVTRLPGARLPPTVQWLDLFGMALVAGVGFTVSLLVAELAFGLGSLHDDHAKVGILAGSLVAALAGAAVLAVRNRWHGRRREAG